MKKQSLSLAITAALGMGASAAMADGIDLAEYNEGVLVPRVILKSESPLRTTVVGLTTSRCSEDNPSTDETEDPGFPSSQGTGGGTVFWTFFDSNSNHVTDGTFEMTDHDFFPYIWDTATAGLGIENIEGYLVFYMDSNGDGLVTDDSQTIGDADCLAANAFQVDVDAQDVEYVPVIPLDDDDFDQDGVNNILANLGPDSLIDLTDGFEDEERVDIRYFVDNTPNNFEDGGIDTEIVIFTTWNVKDDGSGGPIPATRSFTVNIFDDDQDRRSVNFNLDFAELNIVDPETIIGRPAAFTDGFISWLLPDDPNDGDQGEAVIYSVVRAAGFNAAQTLWAQEWD